MLLQQGFLLTQVGLSSFDSCTRFLTAKKKKKKRVQRRHVEARGILSGIGVKYGLWHPYLYIAFHPSTKNPHERELRSRSKHRRGNQEGQLKRRQEREKKERPREQSEVSLPEPCHAFAKVVPGGQTRRRRRKRRREPNLFTVLQASG